jgi:cyclopropane fatty-acyl-phospholipid synthase-like methyltransferase
MDKFDFFSILERFHTFQNPTSEAKLDRLIEYCGVKDGDHVLDIGCGKGWLLQRMAARHAINGVGVEIGDKFIEDARARFAAETHKGALNLHHKPAADFNADPQSFDVAMCIGASFAIGTFEEMLDWLKPCVKPGGVIAVGDIYAKVKPAPPESAMHFSGGAQRTLTDTIVHLQKNGLTVTGLIDSSLDDWDHYESLHWRAADAWLRENPNHPDREAFEKQNDIYRQNHILYDRAALGWALFVCRLG